VRVLTAAALGDSSLADEVPDMLRELHRTLDELSDK
jgi:hypothetical protein